jgi:hypothetical protein
MAARAQAEKSGAKERGVLKKASASAVHVFLPCDKKMLRWTAHIAARKTGLGFLEDFAVGNWIQSRRGADRQGSKLFRDNFNAGPPRGVALSGSLVAMAKSKTAG